MHVDVGGLDIAYELAGSGPPVVLAHGFVGDGRSTWGRQIEALSDEFTVVAWDAPGAGGSPTLPRASAWTTTPTASQRSSGHCGSSRPTWSGSPSAAPWCRDLVTPVTTSVLSELVPGAVHVESSGLTVDELVCGISSAAKHASVVTVDAVTNDDLGLLAEAVAMLGAAAVPAGSAGLASALALRWRDDQHLRKGTTEATRPPRSRPILVLVTSLNTTARDQQERLVQEFGEQVEVFEPSLQDLLDDERFERWGHERSQLSLADNDVVLVSAPDEKSSGASGAADLIAQRLADLVADLHTRHDFSAVVVMGGDGARALVTRWGCTGIAVHGALSEGMPQGVLVGGEVDGLPIVTKAGGFGDRHALVLAVRSCQRTTGPAR